MQVDVSVVQYLWAFSGSSTHFSLIKARRIKACIDRYAIELLEQILISYLVALEYLKFTKFIDFVDLLPSEEEDESVIFTVSQNTMFEEFFKTKKVIQ